jgi:hypothetical protein
VALRPLFILRLSLLLVVSTCHAPYEQWLVGMGTGLGLGVAVVLFRQGWMV